MPLNLWCWLCFHGALKDQLPWSQANHRAGTPGPNNIWRGCGYEDMRNGGPTLAGPMPLPLPLSPHPLP